MKNCSNCNGAIGEPGVAYGYAGKWCQCGNPKPVDLGVIRQADAAEIAKLDEFLRRRNAGVVISGGLPLANLTQSTGSMTPAEFVHWLRGYYAGAGTLPKPIADMLEKVRT